MIDPLSLYIHIPWCIRKCPYCDFNSHMADGFLSQADGALSRAGGPLSQADGSLSQADGSLLENSYIDRLIEDLEQEMAFVQGRSLQSIFFGGGTPSLFSARGIDSILQAVEKRMAWHSSIEITLEANPGVSERKKFADFRLAGVNRLSIGVQSFHDKHLNLLGRIHSGDEARAAIGWATQYFDNINIDLMHSLPEQTADEAISDLTQATAFSPTHLSWYELTIEPNTPFYKAPPTLPNEKTMAIIDEQGRRYLIDQGFYPYEVSAFSRPNQVSQHNLNYWLFGDYIGIGAGAHSKLTDATTGSVTRHWKTRSPKDYLDTQTSLVAGSRTVIGNELVGEFMMNALRLEQGFSTHVFERRTGQSLSSIEDSLNRLIEQDMIEYRDHVIRTTLLGRRFLNDVIAVFFNQTDL